MYRKYFKRVFDFVCSLLALIVLSPVLLVTALLVRIKLGTPVIFKQKRPGLNEKIFTLYKFRTMTDQKDEQGNLLPDEVRLTKFGKMLRSTSLDELPELWNILKGDMSVVGPRPLLLRDVECMNQIQNKRHILRPGLTGFAQCSGRNSLNWDTKLATDVEYVEKLSFILDVRIILKTILKVLKKEDVEFNKDTEMDLKDWNELKKRKTNKDGFEDIYSPTK